MPRGEDALHRRASRAWRRRLAYRSFRFLPAQNSRSNSSLSVRTRFRPNSLPKITVQLASEATISPTITTCTTKLACSTS